MGAATVAKIIEHIRRNGRTDDRANKYGNTVYRMFLPDERYIVDFAPDFDAEGWQQFDTDQDAAYFGVWVNKAKLLTLTYAEGDWILVVAANRDTYRAEVVGMCEFYGEGRIARVIHENGAATTFKQDRATMFLAD